MKTSDGRIVNPNTEFFTDENGEIHYFPKCENCIRECKQSYRILGLHCDRFEENPTA